MKITVEGEPKEIAALEQALKDGERIMLDGKAIAKAAQKTRKLVPPFGLSLTDDSTKSGAALAGGLPMDCPRKWD